MHVLNDRLSVRQLHFAPPLHFSVGSFIAPPLYSSLSGVDDSSKPRFFLTFYLCRLVFFFCISSRRLGDLSIVR